MVFAKVGTDPEESLLFLTHAWNEKDVIIHIQMLDDGDWDYTIYTHPAHSLLDGGVLGEMPYRFAIEEIKKMYSLSQDVLPRTLSLDLLEKIQDSADKN